MNRLSIFAAIVVITCLAGSQAHASSGTVSGVIEGPDFRANVYRNEAIGCGTTLPLSGARQSFADGANVGLPGVLVRVRAVDAAGSWSFYSRTGSTGAYSIPWSTPATVLSVTVYVYPERPDISNTDVVTSKPGHQYRAGNGTIVLASSSLTGTLTGARTRNITTDGSEHLNAYFTAREIYSLYDDQGTPLIGGSIRSDMIGVEIHVNQAWQDPFNFAFTPTDSDIYLPTDTATDFAGVVAHEFGHLLAWRSLDLGQAPINPSLDYNCSFGSCAGGGLNGWHAFTCECEKGAFHDGFADFHTALWMWHRAADAPTCAQGHPALRTQLGDADLESPGTCGNSSDTVRAKKPICTTRALWDIVDNPSDDADSTQNRDLSDIVTAMRRYPRNCAPCIIGDNHCANEGWPWTPQCFNDADGNNWWDFKENWETDFGSGSLNSIASNNGVSGQTSN